MTTIMMMNGKISVVNEDMLVIVDSVLKLFLGVEYLCSMRFFRF